MGKAGRWFRGLLGLKKEKEQCDAKNSKSTASNDPTRKEKKRWGFTKPGKDCDGEIPVKDECTWRIEEKQSKHAMAVAAATAAAADAAVSAAQAAVAVVRLTANNRGTLFCGNREIFAALMIQSIFRGYLARKALRALRALVKLQALVRGFLVRKRASAALLSMEALVRAQLIVKLQRSRASYNKENRFQPRKSTEKRLDDSRREFHSKRVSTSYETMMSESPKTVEVDTYKPKSRSPMSHHIPPRNKRSQDLEWSFSGDEIRFSTAHNTPRLQTSNSPAKSERCFKDYSNYPNYMSNTQSYMAKLRSNSAPKQRPEPGPKKMTLTEIMAARKSVSAVGMHRSDPENQHLFNFSGEAPLLR